MNLWEYLDLRNKRNHLKKEIKILKKEINDNTLYLWPVYRNDRSMWEIYFREKNKLLAKLKICEEKLNELL